MAHSFSALSAMLQGADGSYIGATVAYITEVLDIEIEDFDVKDLPKEWVECIAEEAKKNKLLKDTDKRFSIFSIMSGEKG